MKYILMIALVIGGLFMFMQNGNANQTMKYEELQNKLNAKENFVLLDVRTQEEFDARANEILSVLSEYIPQIVEVLPGRIVDRGAGKHTIIFCDRVAVIQTFTVFFVTFFQHTDCQVAGAGGLWRDSDDWHILGRFKFVYRQWIWNGSGQED